MNINTLEGRYTIDQHFMCSNMAVRWENTDRKKILEYGKVNTEGDFIAYQPNKSESIHVYGYDRGHGHKEGIASLLRIAAWMLKAKLDNLLELDPKRGFVNGGTYGTGMHVEESIIYLPSTYDSSPDRQELFTFYPALSEPGEIGYGKAKMSVNNIERKVTGLRVNEVNNHHFSNLLGEVPIHLDSDSQFVRVCFPDAVLDEGAKLYTVWLNFNDLMRYVDITANLIKQYYTNGLTYAGYKLGLTQGSEQA